MIFSKADIWVLVLGFPDYDGGYPWSKVFTENLAERRHPAVSQNLKYKNGKTNTNLVDPSTSSIADIKRHICFEVPQEIDAHYVMGNLLVQADVSYSTIERIRKDPKLSTTQKTKLGQAFGPKKTVLAMVYRAGAVSAPDFAQENAAFAEAFGDYLLHDDPAGVKDFAPLTVLKDMALRRAKKKPAIQLKQEEELAIDTEPPKHEDRPAIDMDTTEKPSPEDSAFMPLGIRQEIWTALCPRRKCVGGFPFEVPVPPAVRLQKHVVEELEDEANGHFDRGKDKGQRQGANMANYIHPHVRIDVTQRKLPDGGSVHVLSLGLVEHAYNLRFSRLGLLQAYDMVVCWASRIDSEGSSISLKSAFDGCNQITENIVAGDDRIDELAGLEKRLERFTPDVSQFDEAVERISRWMEKHKAKLVSSPEDRERRLRKWCKKRELGDMGDDLLEQACQQAVEVKTREWKKSKRRTKRASVDDGTEVARPTKRRKEY
ncbi:hypothetical protein LY76DRAFT_657747 [Colletotrichum caudatum]|nr:hypothetical protein LY76DRAFT_657747 [Colletotrichum caudatum]